MAKRSYLAGLLRSVQTVWGALCDDGDEERRSSWQQHNLLYPAVNECIPTHQ